MIYRDKKQNDNLFIKLNNNDLNPADLDSKWSLKIKPNNCKNKY